MRVGYADQNGHPYRSIGTVLIERGELTLDRASMQGIREWGRRNPDKLPELLDQNPSYVFFREVPAPAPGTLEAAIDGPFGSLGVPLLRERTIAVDPRSVPLGAPVFLATTYPLSSQPLRRLVLAQDTGGAIRGAVRGDFFWGFGDEAGRQAGRMRQGRPDVDTVAEGCAAAEALAVCLIPTRRRSVRRASSAGEHVLRLLVGVIRRAHHRADRRVPEAHRIGLALEQGERVRVHITQHRQMARARLQVLADGQHVDAMGTHVAHDIENLVVGFAQARPSIPIWSAHRETVP
jgi:3D (Asp-Asp-Asp) domain-containing protein